jgi:hypothetical protein
MKSGTREKCMLCDKDAEHIRSTQFAGDHPYCDEHARMEDDFGQDDSYAFWIKVNDERNSDSN